MIRSAEIFVDRMAEPAAVARPERIEFDEAFSLHHRTVFRAAYSVVRDAALAEDVTQDTFLQLHRHLDSMADHSIIRPWLIRVAINAARNMVRGNIRANTREENYVKDITPEESSSVADEFEQRQTSQEVLRALAKIKEPLRSCLVLKQQGLSYREIADSLGLNETSIGQYVARGRREFVRLYGKIGRDQK